MDNTWSTFRHSDLYKYPYKILILSLITYSDHKKCFQLMMPQGVQHWHIYSLAPQKASNFLLLGLCPFAEAKGLQMQNKYVSHLSACFFIPIMSIWANISPINVFSCVLSGLLITSKISFFCQLQVILQSIEVGSDSPLNFILILLIS